MRFLCDEMLKRLGQWLRIAGYDVLMLPDGTDDLTLVQRALSEGRTLLTRDRSIVDQCRGGANVLVLDCNDLEDCVAALGHQLPIDWLYAPFTRCMGCNTPLVPASEDQASRVPEGARDSATKVLFCPSCEQLFWDGSHVARMRKQLQAWRDP